MSIISVLISGMLALALTRALALRATLSLRTLGTYVVLGALLGPIVWPVAQGFINSYGSYQVYHWPFIALGAQVLLLAPALGFLFFRRAFQVISVGDAFLLAYMTGFGYDLFTALASAAATPRFNAAISYFPPFAFVRPDFTVAGFGYWSGLVALALAAALRFLRTNRAVQVAGALAILWVVMEIGGLLAPARGTPPGLLGIFSGITFHGALTPWASLLALVALSLREDRWISRSGAPVQARGVLTQWSAMLGALAGGNVGKFQRLDSVFRLRRRLEVVKAELSRSPSDTDLMRVGYDLEKQVQLAESNLAETRAAVSPGQMLSNWANRRPLQVALLVAFVVVVLLLPGAPAVQNFFWRLSFFNAPLLSLNLSLLSCALIGAIGWRYLSAGGAPDSSADIDEILQFHAEDTVLQLSLLTVFLALLYGKAEELFFLKSVPQLVGLLPTPNYDHGQLTTIMLLTAATATGVSLERSDRFKQEPIEIRRATVVAKAMNLVILLGGAGATLVFFQQGQFILHSKMGKLLFYVFGRNGNSAGDTIVGIAAIAFGFFVFRGLFWMSERVEDFFAPSAVSFGVSAEEETQTGAHAGIG